MKRLRVRLKADDPSGLRRILSGRLGLFHLHLPLDRSLAAGEPVELHLLYRNRELALLGRGEVREQFQCGAHRWETHFELQWDSGRPLVQAMVGTEAVSQAPPPSGPDLSSDLELPAPTLPADGEPPRSAVQDGRAEAWAEPDRETGEVTPLARIELVRPGAKTRTDLSEPPALSAWKLDPARPEPPGKVILGIDFGASATRVAASIDGSIQTIPTRRGLAALPSFVHIDPSGRTIVGEPAMRRAAKSPEYGIRDVRRGMGQGASTPLSQHLQLQSWVRWGTAEQSQAAVQIGPHCIPLEEVGALLLKEIRESAALVVPDRVNRAVCTVPGWAGVAVRRATRSAARLAGLHVERLVGEAVAAAVHFQAEHAEARGRFVVVVLGAGQLDVARVDLGGTGQVQVEFQGGSPYLGGVEFDRALLPLLLEAVEDSTGERPAETPDFWAHLLDAAQRAKEGLSTRSQVEVVVRHPLADGHAFELPVELDRSTAESRWASMLHELQVEALRVAEHPEQVDGVLLAGGGCSVPAVQSTLRAAFPSASFEWLDAHAAAWGAARLGERLLQGAEPGVTERLAGGVGAVQVGGARAWLVEPGSLLPARGQFVSDSAEDVMLFEGPPVAGVGSLSAPPEGILRFALSPDGGLSAVGPQKEALSIRAGVPDALLRSALKASSPSVGASRPPSEHDAQPRALWSRVWRAFRSP